MTPSENSTQTAECSTPSKVQYEPTPRKYEDDGVSKTPLLKKLFRRKLSGCINQMNTGAHRPKSTGMSSEGNEERDEMAAAKKQRIQISSSVAQKYGVDLSDSEEEEEENSPSPPPSIQSSGKDYWNQTIQTTPV